MRHSSSISRLSIQNGNSPYFLSSKTEELRKINQGAAQPNLNTSIVKAISLNIPSCNEEQTEIVRRVETLFAYADRLEACYHAARAQVEKLTPSLLAKAFRGELVPQDPNDEPVSELLARIAASKSAEQPKARAGKRQPITS